jgi:hypothetical protein
MPATALTVVLDKVDKVVGGIAALAGTRVLVGVPAEEALRKPEPGQPSSPINNAALLYIHENGSPEANIPARKTLVPGVKDAQSEIESGLRKAAEAAFAGQPERMEREYHRVGLKAQAAVRKRFGGPDLAPLAASTLAARRRRGRTGDLPLIDRGILRNAITYVVRKATGRA